MKKTFVLGLLAMSGSLVTACDFRSILNAGGFDVATQVCAESSLVLSSKTTSLDPSNPQVLFTSLSSEVPDDLIGYLTQGEVRSAGASLVRLESGEHVARFSSEDVAQFGSGTVDMIVFHPGSPPCMEKFQMSLPKRDEKPAP